MRCYAVNKINELDDHVLRKKDTMNRNLESKHENVKDEKKKNKNKEWIELLTKDKETSDKEKHVKFEAMTDMLQRQYGERNKQMNKMVDKFSKTIVDLLFKNNKSTDSQSKSSFELCHLKQ